MRQIGFGIQLFHGHSADRTLELARRAAWEGTVDRIWLPDHFGYEQVLVTLAALAGQVPVNLGTAANHPFARNPMELAAGFSALTHLAREREVAVGIGAGAPTSEVFRKRDRLAMVRETILILRELFAGRSVRGAQFPHLAGFFNLREEIPLTLRVPPARPLPIYVAAAGEKMLGIAGELGDGLIISSYSFPTTVVRRGTLARAVALTDAKRKERRKAEPFHKSLHWHISVSRDGDRAREHARASIAMTLAGKSAETLAEWGVAPGQAEAIRAAFRRGVGVEEMGSLVSPAVVEETGLIVAGTPGECVAQFKEVLALTRGLGFDSIDMTLPLGPEMEEAIELLAKEVIPEVSRAAAESWQD